MASKKESTKCSYGATWSKFHHWCLEQGFRATQPYIGQGLEFLQAGLDKGLSTSTLHRHVEAISSILRAGLGLEVSTNPYIKLFLKGISLINRAVVPQVPQLGFTCSPQWPHGSSL